MAGTSSIRRGRTLVAAAAALTLLGVAPVADAANRRVSIGDYRWSAPEVRLDLGEHVTWFWVGPDTAHSVTGDSPNARGLDSDPQTHLPNHRLGDSFALRFDTPGTYEFQCKVHPVVRGTVVVSPNPGDPAAEPDPVPVVHLDNTAPRIRHPRLATSRFRGSGGRVSLDLDERAKLDADYYRRTPRGRRFAGYDSWKGFVGVNRFRFGGRTPHFAARPGNYVALLRGTDRSNNVSRPRELRFEIGGG